MIEIGLGSNSASAVIERLQAEIVRVGNRLDVKNRIEVSGDTVIAHASQRFAVPFHADIARLGKSAQDAKLPPQDRSGKYALPQ